MFLKKIFGKDSRFYLEKGEKYFADERYADARHACQEGLHKLVEGAGEDDSLGAGLRTLFEESGNRLGRINLQEAEYALARNECAKAGEHLELVLELATDPGIRESAEALRPSLSAGTDAPGESVVSAGCAGCSTSAAAPAGADHVPEYLPPHERFELLTQTIPAGLRERYALEGEEFIEGYLLAHGGEEERGAAKFRELLTGREDDILLYELALTTFKAGRPAECEELLNRALKINGENPLCCMGLVQLLTDTGRIAESLPVLGHMVEKNLLIEQSLLFLGDVHLALDNEEQALDSFSRALTFPGSARAAAERLIPILEKRGQRDDAAHLFKRYLKGCC